MFHRAPLATSLATSFAWSLALLALGTLTPTAADACGGTFCDTLPNAMPVDQTGENILFVLDGATVEAHIQIQYDPDNEAAKFAWVIPVVAVPEFEVGSEPLFQSLLSASVPTYGYGDQFDACGGSEVGGDATGEATTSTDESDTTTGGPDVVYQDSVGAYEIAVLQGGTIEGVMQWLADNDYQQDPAAEPILGEYLDQGYLFVALKLGFNSTVDSIHPIVIRYPGNENCVPLRLTRIAAVEDMDVRVFLLAEGRAVPSNYRHVLVNPLMLDWINFADNYEEVISMAVDAFAAEGNAFVTEYAGPSGVVSTIDLHSPAWDPAPFAALAGSPELVVDELVTQGLANCQLGVCEFTHPLILPLLRQWLPVPLGVAEEDFYGCLSCYQAMIDLVAWDAVAFAAAFDERVVAPGLHAVTLLADWPYLTRMFTTISPNEMTVDPIFMINDSLPDVPNLRVGTRTFDCEGNARFDLPDGRMVYLEDPNVWPTFADAMPWEEDVEQAALMGPSQNLSDRTAEIDELLAAWNDEHAPGGADSGSGSGSGDEVGTAGVEGDPGCGCRAERADASGWLGAWLAVLGALGLRGRRSSRRS